MTRYAGSAYKKAAPTEKSLRRVSALTAMPQYHGYRLFVVPGFQYLAATVETIRADVVTQMRFTRRRFDCQRRCCQKIMRTMHTALRWGLFILLNSHDYS